MSKPKKQYGQHFLINESLCSQIADKILNYTTISPHILELGPGQGVLTKYLSSASLKVVEIDPDMVSHLIAEDIVAEDQIINEDFLKVDVAPYFSGEPFILAGNFPYNISSQIIFKMIANRDRIPVMIGMFQKELAQRLIASHGGKAYGVISVLLQAFYTGKKLFSVSPGSFNPPPKVDSLVIELHRKESWDPICEDPLFRAVVKTAFGQRRKMMRNTLKGLVKDKSLLNDPIFTKRPEQLSLEMFCSITKQIKEQNES